MDEARLLELLERYIESTLDDAARAELEALILDHPAARRIFWEYLDQHAAILELKGEDKGRALARLEKPPTRRRPAPPAASLLGPALIAAGLLVGFVLILVLSSTETRVDTVVRPPKKKPAELRLREIEQEREKVLAAPASSDPAKVEDRKKALEDLADRKRRIDEELRAATKPDALVEKKPEEPRPEPAPEEKKTTVALAPAVARITKVEGDVRVGPKPAGLGQEIAAGQGIETGPAGSVEISYPDQSRVEIGAGSVLRDLTADSGKRFALERGTLRSVVARQKGAPMIIDTPVALVTIKGTTFRLTVDPEEKKGARLDVEEGLVGLKHKISGKSVDVAAGFYAVAAPGADLKSQALPIEEILLTSAQARVTGGEWRVAKGGLESVAVFRSQADVLQLASYVTIAFEADANRDYHLWVRGECLGTGPDRGVQDGVIVKFARSQVSQRLAADWGKVLPGPDGAGLSGWGRDAGRVWIGGDGDWYDAQGMRSPDSKGGAARRGDEVPAVVRFSRPGAQTLRLYVFEGPMRIDAIWLSTTQKTRPDSGQEGPVKK